MSFGFGFGLPSWQTLSGGFSPASLFSAGEQGAWYDPSDLTTLFTDSAGTTPVSAPGNGADVFVGLMLDKSQGLVLGSELLSNTGGPFVNTTGWSVTANGSVSVVNGNLRVTNNTATVNRAFVSLTTVVGQTYLFETNVAAFAGGLVGGRLAAGTTSTSEVNGITSITGTGVQQLRFRATATTTFVQLVTYGLNSGGTVDFSYSTVRELPGNHAFQSNNPKRPKLAARYNLLTYTEQFDNGVWTNSSMNAFGSGSVANTTATLDPVGTNTADYIQETNANSTHSLYYTYSTATSAATYTYSIYVKSAGQNRWLRFNVGNNINNWFNPDTGSWGTVDAAYTPTATNVGNGWWRVSLTGIAGATTVYLTAGLASANNTTSYAGTGTSGLFVWGADLRPASQATGLIGPTYQRVVDAATYDTAGFLPYLEFLGAPAEWHMTMDSLVSGTSYFEGANAPFTMFAGVRRNTTGSFMAIAALCANTNATPSNNDQLIFGFSDATTQVFAETRDIPNLKVAYAGTNAAPQTNVITWNRTATDGVARVDGVAGTPVDQTQPALGLALATIGAQRRDPTPTIGAYLNGWLYSLIIRGAQSTQSQIEATESWVAGKTGVSL